MTDERRPGAVRYRIRVYDDNYEIETDRVHLIALDIDTATGLRIAQAELEALRVRLAEYTKVELDRLRLAVHSHPAGGYEMEWIGR